MKRSLTIIGFLLVLSMVLVAGGTSTSLAAGKEVTIAYQLMFNPFKVAIAEGTLEKATGWKINWRQFTSGAKVINAVASGDVMLAVAGSSPIAAGMSRGLPMYVFWILEDIAAAECLVVRNGSGIIAPQDLRGKKLGVPFVSTTHFHTLFALEQFGIDPSEVRILNMQPNAIAAAWERGDIDATFVWDPALGRILPTGKVLITSGLLSTWGKATYDAFFADKKWAEAHPEFMVKFIGVISAADEAYRSNPKAWTPDSPMVKKIARISGGNPEDVPRVLASYDFPTLEEQASTKWLGGGKDSGAARALYFTSQFLKAQKKIPALLPDYGVCVTPKWVNKVLGK